MPIELFIYQHIDSQSFISVFNTKAIKIFNTINYKLPVYLSDNQFIYIYT